MTKKQQTIGQVVPLKGQERLLKLAKEALNNPNIRFSKKGKTPTLGDMGAAVASVMSSTEEGMLANSKDQYELTLALLYYDVRAKKFNGSDKIDNSNIKSLISSVLSLYRSYIQHLGFTRLSTSMVTIVKHYGTIKDKAILCIQHFDYARYDEGKRNPVSQATADAVRNSIHKQGEEAVQEFLSYLKIYDAYTSINVEYNNNRAIYKANAYLAALYIQNYEWTLRLCNIMDGVTDIVKSVNPPTATYPSNKVKALGDLKDKYLKDYFNFGELYFYNKGKKEDNLLGSLQYVRDGIIQNGVIPSLSKMKGMITAVREWAKTVGDPDYMLMPYPLKVEVNAPTVYYWVKEIEDKYYISKLKEKEAKGKTISEEERQEAIFPSFGDVEEDAETKQWTLEELDGTLKNGIDN